MAPRAQQLEPIAGAEESIVRADALGANRDFDGAVALLKRAVDRYPTYTRVYLSLAYWQEIRGLYTNLADVRDSAGLEERKARLRLKLNDNPGIVRELFDTLGRAMLYVPDAGEIQRKAADLVTSDYPQVLGENGPLALPGRPTLFTYTISDPRLPTDRRGTHQCLLIGPLLAPESAAFRDTSDSEHPVVMVSHPGYARDAKYGDPAAVKDPAYANITYNRMLVAYEYDSAVKCWFLRFRVMWSETPSRAEARLALARNTAQLLLRMNGLVRAYTDFAPRFALPKSETTMPPHAPWSVNIWLAEKGRAGGETDNDNIYLFEVGTPRSSAEWVREIAHEYGHETLPVVGGYTKPEWGANGRLGERLFLRWLLRNPDTLTDSHPWVRNIDPTHGKDARIDSLIRQFAALDRGPDSPKMTETDETAMNAFVGLCLYVEATQGGQMLKDVLDGMQSPLYADANGSFKRALEAKIVMEATVDQPVITLHLDDLPSGLPLWVYLQKGTWRLEFETSDDTPARMTVEVDDTPCRSDMPGSVSAVIKDGGPSGWGWHRIKCIPAGNTLPPLTMLRLIKQ
jgi:hypothetical protein